MSLNDYQASIDALTKASQKTQDQLLADALQKESLFAQAQKGEMQIQPQQPKGAGPQDTSAGAFGATQPMAAAMGPAPASTPPNEQESDNYFDNVSNIDFKKHMEAMKLPATGDPRPIYANGLSPKTAIPTSPVSYATRLAMSFGNTKGSINKLKEHFDDAIKLKDGSLAVKKEGLWYQVDPEGEGSGTFWQRSMEHLKDEADLTAGALKTAGLVAFDLLTAPETGGASLLANGAVGAGLEGARTSFGRLLGTYDATPEEQIADAALEGAMNMVFMKAGSLTAKGVKGALQSKVVKATGSSLFKYGVKPTANAIGDLFQGSAKQLGRLSKGTIKTIADLYGHVTGAGDEELYDAFTMPTKVGGWIKRFAAAGKTDTEAIDKGAQQLAGHIGKLAYRARAGLSGFYARGIDAIAKNIPGDFRFAPKEVVSPIFQKLTDEGFGSVNKNGEFVLRPLKVLQERATRSEAMNQIATNKDAYNMLADFIRTTNVQVNQGAKFGLKGLHLMRNVDQTIGNKIHQILVPKARKAGYHSAATLLDNLHDQLDKGITDYVATNLRNKEAVTALKELKTNYKEMKRVLNPILDTIQQNKRLGDERGFASFMNRIFANRGRYPMEKGALRLLKEHLGTHDKHLAGMIEDAQAMKAALAFIPKVRGSFIQFGMAGAIGSAAFGASGGGMLAGGLAAATSPRLGGLAARSLGYARGGINTLATPVKQTMAKQSMQWLKFIEGVRASGKMEQFLQNEDLFKEAFYGAFQAPQVQQATRALVGQGVKQATGQ